MHSANSRNWVFTSELSCLPPVESARMELPGAAQPPNRERQVQGWLCSCTCPSAADAAAGSNLLNALIFLQVGAVCRPLVNQIKKPKMLTAMFTAVPFAGEWTANSRFDDQWAKVWRTWFRIYNSLLSTASICMSTSHQHTGISVGLIPIHLQSVRILCKTQPLCFLLESLCWNSHECNVTIEAHSITK